ncbi:hypothetical protein D3C85_566370 [compost metagenome]
MSVEQMLKSALIDEEATAARALEAAQIHNKYILEQVDRLTALVKKLELEADEGELEFLEEEAADLAEALEIEFIYTGVDGGTRRYSPEAFWEASGGCEWVESAEMGIHYGWNI